ncbi:hypothetical protein DFH06DRAFT_1125438 [Mycena polygramma]|nr:hypothetical protein DFH06DRAFT_1125438 [Mycena polygramma]
MLKNHTDTPTCLAAKAKKPTGKKPLTNVPIPLSNSDIPLQLSNVPVNCALCPTGHPAIWCYNFLAHLRAAHPSAPEEKYASIWSLHPQEIANMKKLWSVAGKGVPIPQGRGPKEKTITISEAHSSRLSMRSEKSVVLIDDSEESDSAENSDDDSAHTTDEEDNVSPPIVSGEYLHGRTDVEMSPAEDLDMSIANRLDSVADAPESGSLAAVNDEMPSATAAAINPLSSGSNHAAASTSTPSASQSVPELGRGKRTRTTRKIDLKQCLCGKEVVALSAGSIKCNKELSETQWYCLECVQVDGSVRNWTCEACLSSAGSSKRARR